MKKKIIIGVAIAIVVIIGCVMALTKKSGPIGPMVSYGDIETLEEMPFIKEIKETGVVESNGMSQVYATLNYPVAEIYASVGDIVSTGDKLAQLDTSDIDEQIASKKVEIAQSSNSSSLQIAQAQRKYDEEKVAVEEETNTTIVNAKQALENAERTMLNANEAYEESGGSDQLFQEAENAQYNYLQAVEDYELSLQSAQKGLATYQDSVDTAVMSSSQESSLMSLENLEKSLEETSIKATMDGTITAVYAVQGSSPTGVMFVIEDLDSLLVESSVSENDVLNVKVGMPVNVMLNTGDDRSYDGVVKEIAPTAQKDASGNTASGTSPLYTVKVELKEANTPFLVGMNVKTDFIIEQMDNAITVPVENIYINDAGDNCILVVEEVSEKENTYFVREQAVTVGNSDNFVQMITGEGLESGMQILGNVEENQSYIGMEVMAVAEEIVGNMGGPMMIKGGF